MKHDLTRRELLAGAGALLARPALSRAAAAPTARVTVAKCKTYGPELVPTLGKMFDQLGGLGRLVKGKTVALKVNFIGVRWQRLDGAKMEDTFWSHPRMIGATVHLLGKAGASRIRRALRRRPSRTFCSPCAPWARAAWRYARRSGRRRTTRSPTSR